MHFQPKRPDEGDLRAQSIVLGYVLAEHPNVHPSIPALVHDLVEDSSDAFEQAILDLTNVGLLRCPDGIVYPTDAARHFDDLPMP